MPDLKTMPAADFLAWMADNTKDPFFINDAREFLLRGISDLATIARFQHLTHLFPELPDSLMSPEGLEAVDLIGEVARRDPGRARAWMEVARRIGPDTTYYGSADVVEAMLDGGMDPSAGLRIAEIATEQGANPGQYGFPVTPEDYQALLASDIEREDILGGYLELGYSVPEAIELAGQRLDYQHMAYIKRFQVPQAEWVHVKTYRHQWLEANDSAPERLRQVAASGWRGNLAEGEWRGLDTDSAIALGKAGIYDEEAYKAWLEAMRGRQGWARSANRTADPDVVALAGMGIKKSNLSEYRMCGAKNADEMRQIAAKLTAQRCKELRERWGKTSGYSKRRTFDNIEALFEADRISRGIAEMEQGATDQH